jgi:uncharacterized protein
MLKVFRLRWSIMIVAGWLLPSLIVLAQLPLVDLSAGMYRIQAELAHTPQNRQIGLMHRETLPENRGMVFVFAEVTRHCMWMRNTLIPLSVAFMDGEGRILNIEDMMPQTDDSHCSSGPAKFALEMNQGWFAKRGIGAGHFIRGIDRLPPAH